jgi:hypothetical protein
MGYTVLATKRATLATYSTTTLTPSHRSALRHGCVARHATAVLEPTGCPIMAVSHALPSASVMLTPHTCRRGQDGIEVVEGGIARETFMHDLDTAARANADVQAPHIGKSVADNVGR